MYLELQRMKNDKIRIKENDYFRIKRMRYDLPANLDSMTSDELCQFQKKTPGNVANWAVGDKDENSEFHILFAAGHWHEWQKPYLQG